MMYQSTSSLLGFIGIGSMGIGELVLIGVVAVLLFGGRLPEVARTFGQNYQRFRKGLADIQSSINADLDLKLDEPPRINDYSEVDDYEDSDVPSFEEPPEEDE